MKLLSFLISLQGVRLSNKEWFLEPAILSDVHQEDENIEWEEIRDQVVAENCK